MSQTKKVFSLIGTHNGQFHCDEALACFLLKKLPQFKDCRIVRTRKPEVLDTCDVVVDVGAIYDHGKLRYDHHQRDFKTTLSDIYPEVPFVTKLSSAGLIYAHYGKEIIRLLYDNMRVNGSIEDSIVDKLYTKIYENFVEEIDAVDNGINATDDESPRYKVTSTVSNRVKRLNPAWNEPTSDEIAYKHFESAMELVGSEFVDRVMYYINSWLPTRKFVLEAIESRNDIHESGAIIKFTDVCPPWKEHLYEIEKELGIEGKILFALYADSNNSWRVQCVSIDPTSFKNRKSLPAEWRGLRDEVLTEKSGIDGCIFVHSSGFIGGNKTYQGAFKMALVALSDEN